MIAMCDCCMERMVFMARPRKHRRLCSVPQDKVFNKGELSSSPINLTVDEYETVRLIDYVGLTQKECAKQMQVARSTVTATYDSARYKISDSIINNKTVIVDGGDFQICENSDHCCGKCGKNKCGRCKHGSCEMCIGIFHEPGRECFAL